MLGPTQVTLRSRRSGTDISVDWSPTDTVSDVLERAHYNVSCVCGVVIGPQYVRGFATEPVWPSSIIEVDDI